MSSPSQHYHAHGQLLPVELPPLEYLTKKRLHDLHRCQILASSLPWRLYGLFPPNSHSSHSSLPLTAYAQYLSLAFLFGQKQPPPLSYSVLSLLLLELSSKTPPLTLTL